MPSHNGLQARDLRLTVFLSMYYYVVVAVYYNAVNKKFGQLPARERGEGLDSIKAKYEKLCFRNT